ncbi:MAG: hypothetical protein Q9160_003796 [Pyrenula sp. 1 TL-2023]
MYTRMNLSSIIAFSTFFLPVLCEYRPNDTSICDYYTTALLQDNSAENQYALLIKLVNTVVIGNYTQPNKGVVVPGILAPGKVNGTDVNLLPYFNGGLASSNRGGDAGVAINFLDGGGAASLKDDKPASSENAMQFMDLDSQQVGYFITQVGLAASSFGVAPADIAAVANSLTELFGYRCAPETEVIKGQGKELQSICVAEDCPEAKDSVCGKYSKVGSPGISNGTMGQNHTVSTGTPSMTMNMEATGTEKENPAQATGTTAGAAGRQAVGGLVLAVAVGVAMGSI